MWTESNTPSKIEGAGGADVPKALIYGDGEGSIGGGGIPAGGHSGLLNDHDCGVCASEFPDDGA